jgi:hypothetical protein
MRRALFPLPEQSDPSWDHARSTASTSAGVLRTVKARQQRSPKDNPRPPTALTWSRQELC